MLMMHCNVQLTFIAMLVKDIFDLQHYVHYVFCQVTAINFGAQIPFGKLRSNKNIQIFWRMRLDEPDSRNAKIDIIANTFICLNLGEYYNNIFPPADAPCSSGSTLRRTTAGSWCQFVLLQCLLVE